MMTIHFIFFQSQFCGGQLDDGQQTFDVNGNSFNNTILLPLDLRDLASTKDIALKRSQSTRLSVLLWPRGQSSLSKLPSGFRRRCSASKERVGSCGHNRPFVNVQEVAGTIVHHDQDSHTVLTPILRIAPYRRCL